jgi:glyoxylase-like metal-dependent hydrolase (beta-lactamase superfamily II)
LSIRFLNCAPMSPWWPRWHLGQVSLLVDTDQGLVLVDTGLGLHDHESPSRLVKFYRFDFGIPYAPERTALRQVESLGIPPEAIRHIVLTHLHFDHAGGLPDFPWAKVHLHRREYEARLHPKTWIERFAYDPQDFNHNPQWVTYEQASEKWFDFEAIPLPFSPRMVLIPLFGHTSGLCGVAIETESGWLLHASDALPISLEYDIVPGWVSRLMLGPHVGRLKAFASAHPEVSMHAGHAWKTFFDQAEAEQAPAVGR